MKRYGIALGLAVVMAGAGGASAYAQDNDGCSTSTLKGDYAFTVAGQILNPDGSITTRNGVAMTHFDGNGGLTQVDYVMSLTPASQMPGAPGGVDKNPAFRTGETGTYQVNQDCTGSAEIDFPVPPGFATGATIKLMFVLSNHGRAIHTVVTEVIPPGKTEAAAPVPAVIHSDGWKLGRAEGDQD